MCSGLVETSVRLLHSKLYAYSLHYKTFPMKYILSNICIYKTSNTCHPLLALILQLHTKKRQHLLALAAKLKKQSFIWIFPLGILKGSNDMAMKHSFGLINKTATVQHRHCNDNVLQVAHQHNKVSHGVNQHNQVLNICYC